MLFQALHDLHCLSACVLTGKYKAYIRYEHFVEAHNKQRWLHVRCTIAWREWQSMGAEATPKFVCESGDRQANWLWRISAIWPWFQLRQTVTSRDRKTPYGFSTDGQTDRQAPWFQQRQTDTINLSCPADVCASRFTDKSTWPQHQQQLAPITPYCAP